MEDVSLTFMESTQFTNKKQTRKQRNKRQNKNKKWTENHKTQIYVGKTEANFSPIADTLILFSIIYLTNLPIKNLESFG